VNITSVKSVGGMALGTSVSVDSIGDVLNARKVIVTLVVSMAIVVVTQSLSKMKPNCWTTRVLRAMVTHILAMVLISEAILRISFKIKSNQNFLLNYSLLK
jgi:hypothetical protein